MAQPVATTHARNVDEAGANLTAGIARVTHVIITNTIAATSVFIQFFDAAVATVSIGTTVPLLVVQVPAASSTVGGTVDLDFGDGLFILTRLSAFGTATAEGADAITTGVFIQAWVD